MFGRYTKWAKVAEEVLAIYNVLVRRSQAENLTDDLERPTTASSLARVISVSFPHLNPQVVRNTSGRIRMGTAYNKISKWRLLREELQNASCADNSDSDEASADVSAEDMHNQR